MEQTRPSLKKQIARLRRRLERSIGATAGRKAVASEDRPDVGNDAAALLAIADKARDSRSWDEAAAGYRRFLEHSPGDAAIWVQYGHALKESGDLAGASRAYRRSLELEPNNADTELQIGHLAKLRGEPGLAARHYIEALTLDPANADAVRELTALGLADEAAEVMDRVGRRPDVALMALDVSDLLIYLASHMHPSGVQRVQFGLLDSFDSLDPGLARRIRFCQVDNNSGAVLEIERAALEELAESVIEGNAGRDEIDRRLAAVQASQRPLTLRKGDCYFVVGSFRAGRMLTKALYRLKMRGVFVAATFYDMLPTERPDLFPPNEVEPFAQALFEIVHLCDAFFAISAHVGRQLRSYLSAHGLSHKSVHTMPLAHARPQKRPGRRGISPAIQSLTATPYVLYVSTIEGRKNHILLFHVWRELRDRLGEAMPKLVLAGRKGWWVDDFLGRLETSGYLGGSVILLHDASDEDLEALYTHALFTTYPSQAEGWGLPIGESLAHGKLCIASDIPPCREVGGDLVVYIDPLNTRGAVEIFERYICNPDLRARSEARIKSEFRPRSWQEVFAPLLEQVFGLAASAEGRPIEAPFLVEPGHVIHFAQAPAVNRIDADADRMGRLARLVCFDGWLEPNATGLPLDGEQARITLHSPYPRGTAVVLTLVMRSVSWIPENRIHCSINGADPTAYLFRGGREFSLVLEGRVGTGGKIECELSVQKAEASPYLEEARRLSVTLIQLSYAASNDPPALVRTMVAAARDSA